MKKRFADPETGWTATRETVIHPQSHAKVIEETITDPLTGEVYRSSRVASYSRTIAEWVGAIRETKEWLAEREREKKRRLRQTVSLS
jgi:hypothetical protein